MIDGVKSRVCSKYSGIQNVINTPCSTLLHFIVDCLSKYFKMMLADPALYLSACTLRQGIKKKVFIPLRGNFTTWGRAPTTYRIKKLITWKSGLWPGLWKTESYCLKCKISDSSKYIIMYFLLELHPPKLPTYQPIHHTLFCLLQCHYASDLCGGEKTCRGCECILWN